MGAKTCGCNKNDDASKDGSKLRKKDATLVELRQRRMNESISSTYEGRNQALAAVGIKEENEVKLNTPV